MKISSTFKFPVITLGSPYGVGYEIFLRSQGKKIFKKNYPVCIGSKKILDLFCKKLKIKYKYHSILPDEINSSANIKLKKNKFLIINIDDNKLTPESIYKIPPELDGKIAFKSIDLAAELVKNKIYNSIVTLPVSKKNISLVENSFSGHTEFFQHKWHEESVFMTFISKKLNILLLTTHMPLKNVPSSINADLINKAIETTIKLKNKLKIINKICFLGLNPHAGENGLIGTEDILIKKIIESYPDKIIEGPIPSDTAFIKSSRKKYGFYISSYHDQALIPFKIFSFESGVNLSYGMKFIRTSADHGTAVKLIGKKKASTKSFLNAYKLAVKLTE